MNITATFDEAMVKAMIAEAIAKERNSWPAEMEAMERQVNILTDGLAQAKAEEREACAKVVEGESHMFETLAAAKSCAAAIRARGQNL